MNLWKVIKFVTIVMSPGDILVLLITLAIWTEKIAGLKYQCFFHNSKGYDSHFIINEIANVEKIKDIDMIPKTEEKYISYSFNNLRFLDSLAFMCPDDSLEKRWVVEK